MNDCIHLDSEESIKQYNLYVIDKIGVCDNIKDEFPDEYHYFTTVIFPHLPSYPEIFANMVTIGTQKNDSINTLEVYIVNKDTTKMVVYGFTL